LSLLEDRDACPVDLRDSAWGYYYHACRRWRGSALTGHTKEALCVAFSPDGKTLASGGMDGTIRLWNPADGKERITMSRRGLVETMGFRPDGKALAVAGQPSGGGELWDVGRGRRRAALAGHTRRIFCLAFSPDGKTMASGSLDGTVRLWDATGAARATLPG